MRILVLLAVLVSCETQCSYESKQEDSKLLACSVEVTRFETATDISVSGTVPGGGHIVMMLAPNESGSEVQVRFGVPETFSFGTTYTIPKTVKVIPMTFLFTRNQGHQYVCQLTFVHDDNSTLTSEELDGMVRTATANSRRR